MNSNNNTTLICKEFKQTNSKIRWFYDDNELYVPFQDIRKALNIKKPNMPSSLKKDLYVKSFLREDISTLTSEVSVTNNTSIQCLTEPGLYKYLTITTSPLAKPFEYWVFGEVLPEIRKTGTYSANKVLLSNQLLKLVEEIVSLLSDKVKNPDLFDKTIQEALSDFKPDDLIVEFPKNLLKQNDEILPIKNMIVDIVSKFIKENKLDYTEVWTKFYKVFKRRYRIDLITRATNKFQKPLQYASEHGFLGELYFLACELFLDQVDNMCRPTKVRLNPCGCSKAYPCIYRGVGFDQQKRLCHYINFYNFI